jgi:hypothetical protein
MGATVATVVCPLGPRVRSFVGRKDNAMLPPDGLLPDVNDPADKLINLFLDKTIKPHGLAALVGAHTTSQQRFFKPQRALDPQDSTPGVWDVLFYPQTLQANPPRRVLKFPSDVVLSTHSRIADEWKQFAGPGGQEHWNDVSIEALVRIRQDWQANCKTGFRQGVCPIEPVGCEQHQSAYRMHESPSSAGTRIQSARQRSDSKVGQWRVWTVRTALRAASGGRPGGDQRDIGAEWH